MSIFDGVELSDEQKEQIQKNHDAEVSNGFVKKADFEAVNKKREELLGETKAAKEAKRLADEEASEAKHQKAQKDGDIESLNNSWQERFDGLQLKLDEKNIKEQQAAVSSVARKFVDSNVVDDSLVRTAMTEAISKRLDVREGKTVVLDAEGNLTSLSEDDLFSEFKSSSMYKPHLVASKASGSGADSGSNNSGSAGIGEKSLSSVSINDKEGRINAIKQRRQQNS